MFKYIKDRDRTNSNKLPLSKSESKIDYFMNFSNIGHTCYMIHLFYDLFIYLYSVNSVGFSPRKQKRK
jgi:hypothetical protein